VIGVGSLQFMLDNGNDMDWFNSNVILGALITSVVALTFLIVWELTDEHPIIDLHLFEVNNFRIGLLTICLGFFAFFGVTVIYPLWLQTTAGYTATWAGLASAPVGILGLVLMPFVGRNIGKMNLRIAASVGFFFFGISMWWLSKMNETASFGEIIAPRLLQGVGMAFFFLPLNQIMFSGVRGDMVAGAAGLATFFRNLSGSLSTAMSIFLWSRRTDFHQTILAQHVTAGGPWSDYLAHLATLGVHSTTAALAYTDSLVVRQAQTMGANDLFFGFAVLFLLLMLPVWLAKPPFPGAGGGGAH
jgi:DHA2 family multidrug resistance protein